MFSDENKSSELAKLLNQYDETLIDTCSLMDDAFPEWMDILNNAKEYRKSQEPIIIPKRCYDELKKHSRNRKEDATRIAAKRAMKILRMVKWSRKPHLLAVSKEKKNENFADNAIYVHVSNDRLFKRILVITQDKDFAYDLSKLNELKSQFGRPVGVYKLIKGGKMVPHSGQTVNHPTKEQQNHGQAKTSPKPTSKLEEIKAADARLSSALNDPNYPESRRKEEVEAQIKAINSLPSAVRGKLKLLVPLEKLKEIASAKKPAEKKVEPKKEAPKKEEKKPEPVKQIAPKKQEVKKLEAPKKEAPAKKEQPKPEPKETRLWYGSANTVKEGFIECAKHYGLMFRTANVAYFAPAHGPIDLTEKDLDEMVALVNLDELGTEKKQYLYRDITLYVQRSDDHFHCYIDVAPFLNPKQPAKPEAPKAKKKAEKPAKATPNPEEKPKEEVVEKPKEKKAAKKTEDKPAKEEKKPAVKKPAEKTPYEIAQTRDHALVCNLNNPNYSVAKKEAAIKAQMELLSKLSDEEISTLKYNKESLEKALEALPKA